jgi:hypothetical protein
LEPDSLSLLATIPTHSTWHSWFGSWMVSPFTCLCRLRPRNRQQREQERQAQQIRRAKREQTMATLRETESLIEQPQPLGSHTGSPSSSIDGGSNSNGHDAISMMATMNSKTKMAEIALIQGEKLCPHWLINVARKVNPF